MSEKVTVTLEDGMVTAIKQTAKDELNDRARRQQEWLGEEKAELSQTSEMSTKDAVRFALEESAKKSVRR